MIALNTLNKTINTLDIMRYFVNLIKFLRTKKPYKILFNCEKFTSKGY